MEDFTKECPYCGQANLTGEDARRYCGCWQARRYRKIIEALENQSSDAEPMKEIDEGIMAELKMMAHLCCKGRIVSVTVSLSDGTTVKIAGKVSRTARLKLEEKVDE